MIHPTAAGAGFAPTPVLGRAGTQRGKQDVMKKTAVCPICAWVIGYGGLMLATALMPLAGGCDALNPAFVDAVAPDQAGSSATIDNPPGHVVVAFVNNAEVDEQLLAYLETEGGLVLTDAEKRALRPRLRFIMRITSTNGTTTDVEFVSGSDKMVDQQFAATSANDLDQFPLVNTGVFCDVARVEVRQGTVEAFIPVQLDEYELVNTTGPGGTQTTEFVIRSQIPPAFRTLQVDDGTLLANIGIRDVPGPVVNPLCGSVVAITVNGVLTVPFAITDSPSYDQDDAASIASIGGRYEFRISIQ